MTDTKIIVPSRVEKAEVEPLQERADQIVRDMQGQKSVAFTPDVITITQVKDGSPVEGTTDIAPLLERLDGTAIVAKDGYLAFSEEPFRIDAWVVPFEATSEGRTVVAGKVKALAGRPAYLKWGVVEAGEREVAAD